MLVGPNSKNKVLTVVCCMFAKSYVNRGRDYWVEATIVDNLTPVTFMVKTKDNLSWKRHINQLLTCSQTLKNKITPPMFELDEVATVSNQDKTSEVSSSENVIPIQTPVQSKSPVFGVVPLPSVEEATPAGSETPKLRRKQVFDL